jgi:DNA modification methylase
MVAFALRADGWYLRQDIIWAKPNPMPESVTDRCTKAHEYLFLLTKQARYYYDAKAIAEPALQPVGNPREASGVGFDHKQQALGQQRGGYLGANAGSETRNRRSVWPIATQPFSGAHFATMPPDLVEPCIKAGTSERGQCPHCGAPWVRETSRGAEQPDVAASSLDRYGDGSAGVHRKVGGQYQKWLDANPMKTIGWSPSCTCPAHDPIPQTVLDPFGGAGTTALVADRLQRNATIIELNPAYAQIARDRINGDGGLFAEVAAE